MQTLVDALAARLPEGQVHSGTRVSSLSRLPNGRWEVATEAAGGTEALIADAVCLALPAYRAAALLEGLDGELAALLNSIPYGRSATVNLAYRREEVQHPLNGFGFVVPAVEKRVLLGCTFSSIKFPLRAREGHVLLRAFLGETGLAGRDDEAVEAAVRAELDGLLGITAPPLFTRIHRQDRAMAHFTIGHLDRVAAIESVVARYPGLAVAGNAYHGIGIPDCVRSGEAAAERVVGERDP
jgi:oxygen-dependent protoporphyrinogen oxidase